VLRSCMVFYPLAALADALIRSNRHRNKTAIEFNDRDRDRDRDCDCGRDCGRVHAVGL